MQEQSCFISETMTIGTSGAMQSLRISSVALYVHNALPFGKTKSIFGEIQRNEHMYLTIVFVESPIGRIAGGEGGGI